MVVEGVIRSRSGCLRWTAISLFENERTSVGCSTYAPRATPGGGCFSQPIALVTRTAVTNGCTTTAFSQRLTILPPNAGTQSGG
jgi:hypothetical protein